jgi:para-aminobenzoate synthetase/4-amino-4-deoxychorismate lyase
MTSTVSGRLPRDTGLPALLRALFPCGSVTGAPKHRSRQIIQEIEGRPRGIYTGSIGYLDPDGSLLLNVSIRTLELEAGGAGTLGIGGGIVADSTLVDEWEECFIKARFLTGADPGFSLIETMLAVIAAPAGRELANTPARQPASGIFDVIPDSVPLWPQHAERLCSSARHFGFSYDWGRIARAVQQEINRLGPGQHRLRLLLDKSGQPTLSSQPLGPMAAPGRRPRVAVGTRTIRSDAWHQAHKTTFRPVYDEALAQAEREGLWDLLFFNEKDELVEGARSCVVLSLDGRLVTPPLSAGALPGVGRARLLGDPARGVYEASLTRSDLARAERVFLCNAVRGLFEVDLDSRSRSAAQ